MAKPKNKPKTKKILKLKFSGVDKEKDLIFENLSIMISSGVGIAEALETLKLEISSPKFKKLLDYLLEQVNDGVPFWKAIEQVDVLPKRFNSLIKVGEESGLLAENLKVVVSQQQKDKDLKTKIHSALIYPSLIVTVMIIVASAVALFVLPKLTSLYKNLKVELPLVSQILVNFGTFLEEYGMIAVPGFLIVFFGSIFFIFFYKKTKFIGNNILLHTPVINRILKEVEVARFGFILGNLMKTGLPITFALESLIGSTESKTYKKFYQYLNNEINEGASFQKCFKNYPKVNKLMPIYVQHLVANAERSGNLNNIFRKIGKIYEKKSEVSTKNLTVLIEPILLILVWVGVCFIAFAVIIPIYSLVGNFSSVTGQ